MSRLAARQPSILRGPTDRTGQVRSALRRSVLRVRSRAAGDSRRLRPPQLQPRAAAPGTERLASPGAGVAQSQHSTDVHNLLIGSLFALVLLAFASAVLGWFLAGRLLRPLRSITENAREISASNLHRRLDLAGPDDEFKELGLTLDDLFGRLEASFDAQRRFVANASHELRTPLAAERTVLQVALADPDANGDSLRAACQQVITLGEQQERLINALLTLASTESGVERSERCDLAAIAAAAVQARGSEIEQRRCCTP